MHCCGCGQRRRLWAPSPLWRRCHGHVHPLIKHRGKPQVRFAGPGSGGAMASSSPWRRCVGAWGVLRGGVAGVGCLVCLGDAALGAMLSRAGCCRGHGHPGRNVLHLRRLF